MSNENYHIACEKDSTEKSSGRVGWLFFILGISLFLIMWGLTIMFRFQVDHEQKEKIGLVLTDEVLDAKAKSEAVLSGKVGLFPDKKNVDIDTAKRQFLFELRR